MPKSEKWYDYVERRMMAHGFASQEWEAFVHHQRPTHPQTTVVSVVALVHWAHKETFQGVARQNPVDEFSRPVGRETAFEAALLKACRCHGVEYVPMPQSASDLLKARARANVFCEAARRSRERQDAHAARVEASRAKKAAWIAAHPA